MNACNHICLIMFLWIDLSKRCLSIIMYAMYTCVNHVKFHDVLSHDWVMDECLQSCIHSIHICIYEWIMWNFTICVTAWLSNGWMPVIINACGQIFACIKQTIYFMLLVSYSLRKEKIIIVLLLKQSRNVIDILLSHWWQTTNVA